MDIIGFLSFLFALHCADRRRPVISIAFLVFAALAWRMFQ